MILAEWNEYFNSWILTATVDFDAKVYQVRFALFDLDYIYDALANMMLELERGIIHVQDYLRRGRTNA